MAGFTDVPLTHDDWYTVELDGVDACAFQSGADCTLRVESLSDQHTLFVFPSGDMPGAKAGKDVPLLVESGPAAATSMTWHQFTAKAARDVRHRVFMRRRDNPDTLVPINLTVADAGDFATFL